MKKKIFSILVTAILTLTVTVTTAFAETDEYIHNENNFIPDYFEENGINTSNHPIFDFEGKSRTLNEFERTMFLTYTNGKYYSTTEKACVCHATCNYGNGTTCIGGSGPNTCLNFDKSIQCAAFAKHAHYLITDRSYADGTSTNYNISVNVTTAKEKLLNSSVGTIVIVQTNTNYQHYMTILATTNDKITLYHANYGGACKVALQTVTWAEYAAAFPYLYKKVF